MPLFSNRLFIWAQRLILALAMAVTLAPALRADTVEGLYEATRPIADQSRELRQEAIRSAFVEVLARISGRTDLEEEATLPGIAEALDRATHYVQQYRYGVNPDARSDQDPRQQLWVRFDPRAVTTLLRENGLPVWGSTRPATLIWLAIDQGRERKLIANNSDHPARQILQQQARLRGLPIRFPFLDLADRSSLQVTDVWGNFEERIAQASARYETEATLVGRVNKTRSGLWQARWTLYERTQRNNWLVTGQTLDEVLIPGIDQTTRAMATRYADVGQADASHLLLEVRQITGLGDFNRVLAYLRALSPVSQVQPYSLQGDKATFALTARSGRSGIVQAISLGHVLIKATETNEMPAARSLVEPGAPRGPDLTYRLIP